MATRSNDVVTGGLGALVLAGLLITCLTDDVLIWLAVGTSLYVLLAAASAVNRRPAPPDQRRQKK